MAVLENLDDSQITIPTEAKVPDKADVAKAIQWTVVLGHHKAGKSKLCSKLAETSCYVSHDLNPNKRIMGVADKNNLLEMPVQHQYIPHLVTNACKAQRGILVISAQEKGDIKPTKKNDETKKMVQLAKSLGITKLIVCINKMDTIDWSQGRYKKLVAEMESYCNLREGDNVKFLPVSAQDALNISSQVEQETCAWFTGSLLDTMNSFHGKLERYKKLVAEMESYCNLREGDNVKFLPVSAQDALNISSQVEQETCAWFTGSLLDTMNSFHGKLESSGSDSALTKLISIDKGLDVNSSAGRLWSVRANILLQFHLKKEAYVAAKKAYTFGYKLDNQLLLDLGDFYFGKHQFKMSVKFYKECPPELINGKLKAALEGQSHQIQSELNRKEKNKKRSEKRRQEQRHIKPNNSSGLPGENSKKRQQEHPPSLSSIVEVSTYNIKNELGYQVYSAEVVQDDRVTPADQVCVVPCSSIQLQFFNELKRLTRRSIYLLYPETVLSTSSGNNRMVVEPVLTVEKWFYEKQETWNRSVGDVNVVIMSWWSHISVDFIKIFSDIIQGLLFLFEDKKACGDLSFSLFVTEFGRGKILPSMKAYLPSMGVTSSKDDILNLSNTMRNVLKLPFPDSEVSLSEFPPEVRHYIRFCPTINLTQVKASWAVVHPLVWNSGERFAFLKKFRQLFECNLIDRFQVERKLFAIRTKRQAPRWQDTIPDGVLKAIFGKAIIPANAPTTGYHIAPYTSECDLSRFMVAVITHHNGVEYTYTGRQIMDQSDVEGMLLRVFPYAYLDLYEALTHTIGLGTRRPLSSNTWTKMLSPSAIL